MDSTTLRNCVLGILALLLLIVVVSLALPAAGDAVRAGDVMVITPGNVKEFMRGDGVVMIHAPWCGHCAKMLPTFKEAAKRARGSAQWATCDGHEHPEIARSLNVRGFPTCFRVKDGKLTEYQGDRSLESLLAFAE